LIFCRTAATNFARRLFTSAPNPVGIMYTKNERLDYGLLVAMNRSG
jgi:hypothetical protein